MSPVKAKSKTENKDESGMPPVEQNNKSLPAGHMYSEDYLMLGNILEQNAAKTTPASSDKETLHKKSNRAKNIFSARAQKTWEVLGSTPSQREMRIIRLGLFINGLLCCIVLLLALLMISGRIAIGSCECSKKPGNKYRYR